jgi:GDP-L-fucose synthase
VDDLADATIFLMHHYSDVEHINVGTGEDLTIAELAHMVGTVVYPEARIVFDTSKPDGAPRKLLNVSKLHALGWRHRTTLADGLAGTYRWFLDHHFEARGVVSAAPL